MNLTPLVNHFMSAAHALESGLRDSGYTSNGLRKLDFSIEGKVYTAITQNPNKLSVPAQLAKAGHQVVQIRDDGAGKLLGFCDLTTKHWTDETGAPQNIVDIRDIEAAVSEPTAVEH